MSTHRVLRWAAASCASLPLVLAGAAPTAAATPVEGPGSGTATVGVSSDAWYAASSACTSSPSGCLPTAPPASPYPAKTLHIGVAAGQEESRAYISLDLTALPAGTSLTGGTLRLPVGSNQDGSVSPSSATLQACIATGSFKDDVEGSPDQPPAVDCKRASSKAKYVAAAGSVPEMLTVDLGPFASAWSLGGASEGIALLPTADTAAPSTWHVALSAHDRDVPVAQHITALVSYGAAVSDVSTPFQDTTAPAAAPQSGTGSASFAAPPLAPAATDQVPTTSVPANAPVIAPQSPPVPTVQQFRPQAAVTVGGFAYPGVFLLPIGLALACGWLARALTRDLTPAV